MCSTLDTSLFFYFPLVSFSHRMIVVFLFLPSGAFLASLIVGGNRFRDQLVQVADKGCCFFRRHGHTVRLSERHQIVVITYTEYSLYFVLYCY